VQVRATVGRAGGSAEARSLVAERRVSRLLQPS
jgi:hypothetical protein